MCGHAGASPRALAAAQERSDGRGRQSQQRSRRQPQQQQQQQGKRSQQQQQGKRSQEHAGPSGTLDLLERWILAGTLDAGWNQVQAAGRSPHRR
jgi:hypothetical protein